jgi:hypothetical protein
MDKPYLQDSFVSETSAQGTDLVRCLEKLETAIANEDRATAVSSLLVLAVHLQAPHLTEDQLQQVVWELSKYTCLLLVGSDTPTELKH